MKNLILCNHLERLKRCLALENNDLRYLCLADTPESNRIQEFLRNRPGSDELAKARLFKDRRDSFSTKYVEFMARVNVANSSALWWAMTFTNKNPLSTFLCSDTASFLLIVDLIRSSPVPLVVVSDSPTLARQVMSWGKTEGVDVANLIQVRAARTLVKLHTPAGTIRAAIRTLLVWLLVRQYRPRKNHRDQHLVIATLTHPRSFADPQGYRDAYFGELAKHVDGFGYKPLILAMVLERPFQQLKLLKSSNSVAPVLPLESCLTLRDFVACGLRSLGFSLRPLRLKGTMEIDGLDLTRLVKDAVDDARHSGDLFLNLRVYYSARWLANTVRVSKCLYPFENRAWEKMLLAGFRRGSPETRLVGYQHASLTDSHTNFLLGQRERHSTPLPDSILTTGKVMTKWLETKGNYPPGFFKTACALRQGGSTTATPTKTQRPVSRLLLALASSREEYVKTLTVLERALSGVNRYHLRLRPHPEITLESALHIRPLTGPKFFTESTGSLPDDLQWADVVLYASSTVGLEAVSMGIPAIYLDLGDFLDTDPMSGWDELKWSASGPSELCDAIQAIEDLPQREFQARQEKGREYVSDYLSPVTPAGLKPFLE